MTDTKADVQSGRIGDLTPRFHIRFSAEETERLKALAFKLGAVAFKGALIPGWWERTCLARWGIESLMGREITENPPRPVTRSMASIRVGGERLELRTRRHRELEDYHHRGEKLFVGYPIRRLRRLRPDVFVIAASVKTNDDGSSSTFVWGALSHQAVREICDKQPILASSAKGWGRLKEGPPLGDFDGELLGELLGDEAQ